MCCVSWANAVRGKCHCQMEMDIHTPVTKQGASVSKLD